MSTTYLPVVNNVITINNDKMLSSFHGIVYNVDSILDASNQYCLNIELLHVEENRNQMIEFEIFFTNKSTVHQMNINGEYYPMTLNIRNTTDPLATFFSQTFCIVNRDYRYIIMSKMYAWK
jgi:hypothetical protein